MKDRAVCFWSLKVLPYSFLKHKAWKGPTRVLELTLLTNQSKARDVNKINKNIIYIKNQHYVFITLILNTQILSLYKTISSWFFCTNDVKHYRKEQFAQTFIPDSISRVCLPKETIQMCTKGILKENRYFYFNCYLFCL